MDIKTLLSELANSYGVAGNESKTAELAKGYLCKYFDRVEVDDSFNVYASTVSDLSESKKPLLLLEAHIDEIGLVVTHITEDGFLKIANCGGLDRRILMAQEVTVFGKEIINGIVTSLPPHLETDHMKTPEVSDIYIDIGYSKEQAQKLVAPGDMAVFSHNCTTLLNDRLSCKSLDNRAGMAAVFYALELIKDKKLPCEISVLFSAKEELDGSGATVATYKLSPSEAIAVDVSFALTPDDKVEKCGKMSKGVMIGVSPSLDRRISEKLISLARKLDIKYQLEAMSGKTGTDADNIAVSKAGVKTSLLSIPIRYMHTPTELVDIEDIKATGELMAAYIMQKDAGEKDQDI